MSIESETSTGEIFAGCKLNREPASIRGYIDGTIVIDSMPNNPTPEEIVVYRRKGAYAARERQIRINLLGLEGGRPYVNNRLSRFAGETEIDWVGGRRPDGSQSTGRLQQTHAFPYLGRIAGKINQYVFNKQPERRKADAAILKDITRDGKSINDVMREVSDYTFACGWCWLGVDSPARKEDGTQYTLQEKDALKIRPYWQVYSPLDVLDWYFNERGELEWIKTQRMEQDDSSPASVPIPVRVVSVWERGLVTEYRVNESSDKRFRTGRRMVITAIEIPLTDSSGNALARVPFVLAGSPSEKSIAFDDLESINRTIMDLGSVDRANFFNANYPQLVLPASLMQRCISDGYARSIEEVGKLVLGFKYPITLERGDPEPKYLMPDPAALKGGADRISALKSELFQVVGLSLEQESRQVASAEAKAWDFLDVAAVMAARAELLEDVERKAIALSALWDSSFQVWEPKYNRDFDVGNFKDEVAALVMAGNMPVPTEVTREIVKKLVDRLDRIGANISDEQMELLTEAIDDWEPNGTLALSVP
jgi:hypothetical protein